MRQSACTIFHNEGGLTAGMIRITYSAEQQGLAEQIRDDLAGAAAPAQPILLVLVSAPSNSDPTVQAEIRQAQQKGSRIIPILAENTALPELLAGYRALDFAAGYHRRRLWRSLSQAAMTKAEVRQANRRALMVIAGIALLMFGLAIVTLMSGLIAFPVDEYNHEATFQAQWIHGMIGETLEAAQPRSTQDALHFEATLAAAPTRLFLYIRATATAMPKRQEE